METGTGLQNEFVETPTAKEAVFFANSPSYILNRLRKDSSASYVTRMLSTSQIIEAMQRLTITPLADIHQLVEFYVLLSSLALKDDTNRFKAQLHELKFGQIQWASEILDMILQELTPTSFSTLRIETKQDIKSSASTSTAIGIVSAGG